jgi:hypothetical protein
MPATTPTDVRRRRDELVLQVQRADDAAEVFAETSTRLRRLVPFDAAVWFMTDPGTGLPVAPTRVENLDDNDPEYCSTAWRREFMSTDVTLLRDIARAEVPAAALRATLADPRQSARYREFVRPQGYDDELRAVLRVGSSPWGATVLWRDRGRPPFTEQEVRLVASLSAPLGEALRVRSRLTQGASGLVRHDQPGLLLFDGTGGADLGQRAGQGVAGRAAGVPAHLAQRAWRHAAVVASGHGAPRRRRRARARRRNRPCQGAHPPRHLVGVPRRLPLGRRRLLRADRHGDRAG